MRTRIKAAAPVPVALLAALGLVVAGCGASEVRTPPEPSPAGATPSPTGTGGQPETELTIDITTADSASPSGPADTSASSSVPSPSPTEPQHWRLTCQPAGGDHPEPEAACADLSEAGGAEAFEEVPAKTPCTFIYGGPQIARVEGHVGDTRIDTKFTKSGGCEMKRYEDLGAVLAP